MDTSVFLARVIGLFVTLSTAAILLRYKKALELEAAVVKNPMTTYLSGFLILILGILLVVSHQLWTSDWRVIITVIGWLVLLKGLLRIFFPEAVGKLIAKKQRNRHFVWAEVAVLLLGLYLLYQGFLLH